MKIRNVDRRYVRIDFLDHAMQSGADIKPIHCCVVGILFAEDKNAYYVATWLAEGNPDNNMESFSILKKVITKLTYLGPSRGKVSKRKKASN